MIAGLEKKNRVLNPRERRTVAYHEMGHALVAMALPGSDPVHKISIIPRGVGALGYTIQRPLEDRFLMTTAELENKMAVLLGGRAAEHVAFDEISTGGAPKAREFSEETAREIDAAVRGFVDRAFAKAVGILTDKRAILERGAQLLLQKETLNEDDLKLLQAAATAPAPATA
jgi:cell division protease FtsH